MNYQILLTKRQIEELAKFSMDIAKLSIGSWILGLFTPEAGASQFILAFSGLIFAFLFFTLGLRLFREVS